METIPQRKNGFKGKLTKFMRKMAEDYETKNNSKAAKAVVQIDKPEQQREAHREVHQVLTPQHNASILYIEIDSSKILARLSPLMTEMKWKKL